MSVLVMIVIVIILIFLAVVTVAVLFVIFTPLTGPSSNGTEEAPTVTFSSPESLGSNVWKVTVESVSEADPVDDFDLSIMKDHNFTVFFRSIAEPDPLGRFTFVDVAGHDRLTAGDYFTVVCDPGSMYILVLSWGTFGLTSGSVEWNA